MAAAARALAEPTAGPSCRCGAAVERIREAHYQRSRGEGQALDGHALLTRLKVAAALSILAGHGEEVTDDDWHLAGLVMTKSDETRQAMQKQLAKARAAVTEVLGRADGRWPAVAADAWPERRRPGDPADQRKGAAAPDAGDRRNTFRSSAEDTFDDVIAGELFLGGMA